MTTQHLDFQHTKSSYMLFRNPFIYIGLCMLLIFSPSTFCVALSCLVVATPANDLVVTVVLALLAPI